MKGKLQEYALIAEIITACCIVISLVFVGLQVRQGSLETKSNTEALLSSNLQASLDTELEYFYKVLESGMIFGPELTVEGYSEEELRKSKYLTNAMFRMRESQFHQFNSGALSDNIWETYKKPLILLIINDEIFQEAWKNYEVTGNNEFVYSINSELSLMKKSND